jgi:protocatechuate 3,4-dioxygenase beta subunit
MTVLDHDAGLCADFPLVRRRRLLGLVGGTTVAALAGSGLNTAAARTVPVDAADGSARPDVLLTSGIVRQDIRRSFGKARGVAKGVPLSIRLRLVGASAGEPAVGRAVYLWQCDRDGLYSLYSPGLTAENYLRGVQASDGAGWLSFTSIFPACYAGRGPHLHVEIYPGIAEAADARNKLHTARIALPATVCSQVYATDGYGAGRQNLTRVDAGGDAAQMASVTGSVADGYTATVTLSI